MRQGARRHRASTFFALITCCCIVALDSSKSSGTGRVLTRLRQKNIFENTNLQVTEERRLSHASSSCAAGEYEESGSCKNCAAGKFSQQGENRCSTCPSGWHSNAEGLSQCEECPAGSYSDSILPTKCTLCSPGSYTGVNDVGQSSCTLCDKLLSGSS